MSDTWNAATYSKFLAKRTRPARDLLAVVPDDVQPQLVYDLGCGPGNSTALLKARWPEARVIGVDSSEDMLAKAQKTYPDIEFMMGDIAQFSPESGQADVIFANASFQWVDNHESLFPYLAKHLKQGGVLAVQMPNNFHYPSHQMTINVLQSKLDWQQHLGVLRYGALAEPFYSTHFYYDLLVGAGFAESTLWETEYNQVMESHQAIYEWTSGTGLRPVLQAIENDAERETFVEAYVDELKQAYPEQVDGSVLFPFRRLFMMAVK